MNYEVWEALRGQQGAASAIAYVFAMTLSSLVTITLVDRNRHRGKRAFLFSITPFVLAAALVTYVCKAPISQLEVCAGAAILLAVMSLGYGVAVGYRQKGRWSTPLGLLLGMLTITLVGIGLLCFEAAEVHKRGFTNDGNIAATLIPFEVYGALVMVVVVASVRLVSIFLDEWERYIIQEYRAL